MSSRKKQHMVPLASGKGRLALTLWCALISLAAHSDLVSQDQNKAKALQIIQAVREGVPTNDFTLEGTLKLRSPQGRWITEQLVRFELRRLNKGWQAHYLVWDQKGQITDELVILHQQGLPNRYFHQTGTQPVQILEGKQAAVPFAGSQFLLWDLGLEFLWWPEHLLLGNQMRKGRACYVVESINPESDAQPYHRVRSWIDAEKLALLRAEAFDVHGQSVKVFEIGSVQKIHGQWYLKSVEIRDIKTDARTRLEFSLLIE